MFFGIHLGQEKITCKASNIWSVFGYTGRFSTHSNQHQKTTSKAVVREDTLESKWNNSTKLHFTNKKLHTAATQHQSFQWRTVILLIEIVKDQGSYLFSKKKLSMLFSYISIFRPYLQSTNDCWLMLFKKLTGDFFFTVKLNIFFKFWKKLQLFMRFYDLNIFPEYSGSSWGVWTLKMNLKL